MSAHRNRVHSKIVRNNRKSDGYRPTRKEAERARILKRIELINDGLELERSAFREVWEK